MRRKILAIPLGRIIALVLCLVLAVACKAPPATDRGQTIEVSLAAVEPGVPQLVGSIHFSQDGSLSYRVSAEEGSGLFVGVHQQPELPEPPITWERYMTGDLPFTGNKNSICVTEAGVTLSGTYYVYIGSSDTALSNVTGTIHHEPPTE